jgi:hypothetical protein
MQRFFVENELSWSKLKQCNTFDESLRGEETAYNMLINAENVKTCIFNA